jgi:hypothetical protein
VVQQKHQTYPDLTSTMSQEGGDLFDMAKDGTKVPEDAAKPRIIPSKPRPDQIASEPNPNSLGAPNLAAAADNAEDIPRVSSSCMDQCYLHPLTTLKITVYDGPSRTGSSQRHRRLLAIPDRLKASTSRSWRSGAGSQREGVD